MELKRIRNAHTCGFHQEQWRPFFSKPTRLVPTKPTLATLQVGNFFFKNVFKYHGMPVTTVLDRHMHFTSRFWEELFKLLDTQL